MTIEITKTGYHIVQAHWGNSSVTVSKEGYQLIVSAPLDSVVVSKLAQEIIWKPSDGVKASDLNGYMLTERAPQLRNAALKAYVVFRPIPVPPRKTVVIINPGRFFGGSGFDNPLAGGISQDQEFSARMRLPQNLAGSDEQDQTFGADLFVDNSVEDVFLIGDLNQSQSVVASFNIPHNLGGIVDQEQETVADLFVDTSVEDIWLEGSLTQTSIYSASMSIGGGDEFRYNITIPSQTSTLTGFPVMLDLGTLPDTFWDNYVEHSLRMYQADGTTEIPLDVVSVDESAKIGTLFFKANTLSNSVKTTFMLKIIDDPLEVAPTDTHGRNAVWSDYEAMFAFASMDNRTGNGKNATLTGGAATYAYTTTATSPAVNMHQGVAWDPVNSWWFVFDNEFIKKYNASWTLLQTTPAGAWNSPGSTLNSTGISGVNHFGDGTIYDGELFIVLEDYPNSPYNNQHITVWDPSTLAFLRSYNISAQLHEVSGIAIVADVAYITEFTSPGSSRIHTYDILTGAYIGAQAHSGVINSKQGITYHDGALYISCAAKSIYRLDMTTWVPTLEWSGSISGDMEGITSNGTNLYVLFDGSPSAVYTFTETSSDSSLPGWLKLTGAGHAKALASLFTQWTCGVSFVPKTITANGALLSYSADITADTSRASLVSRNTSLIGIWNSTNSWLMTTGALAINGRYRGHMRQNATTQRSVGRNGVITNGATAQRPASGASMSLFMGAEDASAAERLDGALNFAYLRNGLLTDDWIAAEVNSWEKPGTFYAVTPLDDALEDARYWRLNVETSRGSSGVDLYTVDWKKSGVSLTNPTQGLTATASSYYVPDSLSPSNAFDGNVGTRWSSDFSGSWPQWLTYDLGTGNDNRPDELVITVAMEVTRAPGRFQVQYSHDNVNWKTVWSVNDTSSWTLSVPRSFSLV